jgi:hypothetical protein
MAQAKPTAAQARQLALMFGGRPVLVMIEAPDGNMYNSPTIMKLLSSGWIELIGEPKRLGYSQYKQRVADITEAGIEALTEYLLRRSYKIKSEAAP